MLNLFANARDYIESERTCCPYLLMVSFVSLSSFQLISDFIYSKSARNVPGARQIVCIFGDIFPVYYYYDSYLIGLVCVFGWFFYGEYVRMNRIEMQLSNTEICSQQPLNVGKYKKKQDEKTLRF